MDFGASVKSDSAGLLRGAVRCTLTPGGLSITKGTQPPLMIPRGVTTRYEQANRFTIVDSEGRLLGIAVNKVGSYQPRLTRELAAYLGRERATLPVAREFRIELYLLIPALLPLGIMVLTRGGMLWGAIGGALAFACLSITQNENLPRLVRLAIILAVSLVAYPGVIALMAGMMGAAR